MTPKKAATAPETTAASAELELLRTELRRLARRVAALEETAVRAHPAPAPALTPAPVAPPPPKVEAARPAPEPIPEEIVLVLSAAIAAFLGKRPVIRQIRLLQQQGWAHAGRVTIQGSHALHPR